MKILPRGVDNFKDIIDNNYYYVDKTLAIEDILKKDAGVILFSRPRRFGKSLFISMLEHFFDVDKREENAALFEGLYISKSPYYSEKSKYPVINLDFKSLKESTFLEFYEKFQVVVSRIFIEKKYVLEILSEKEKEIFNDVVDCKSSQGMCEEAIKYLTDWLYRYHKEKVIILIDEYDVCIQEGYMNNYYNEIIDFIKSVFSSSLKGNDSLKFGILTGVLRIGRESLFSDLNNLVVYDIMSSKYNEYFGFTESETRVLLQSYGLELNSDIKEYYDGYNIGGVHIYNPWSILNYASEKDLISYWVNTSSNNLLKKMLKNISLEDKKYIERLINGESVSFVYDNRFSYIDFDNINDINKVLNLLFMTGYLTFDKKEESIISDGFIYYFRIPNKEVRNELIKVSQSVTYGKDILDNESYEKFLISLVEGNKEYIEEYLNDLLMSASYYDTYENFYHGYLLGLFSGFLNDRFIVKSNRESGNGRYDVMIMKKDRSFGIIVEIKVSKNGEEESIAIEALEQIEKLEYINELKLESVDNILKYAIVFVEKKAIVR